jgi:hypothetical protein
VPALALLQTQVQPICALNLVSLISGLTHVIAIFSSLMSPNWHCHHPAFERTAGIP